MPDFAGGPGLSTFADAGTTAPQRRFAVAVAAAFGLLTLALLPIVAEPVGAMPGFVPSYQAALITVYAVTTYLFFAQYRRTRSVPLLVLAAGSLYTTQIVAIQLLSFPGMFGPGRLVGAGPDTTTWLWTLWHIGPPLFALPYAIMEGDRRPRLVPHPRVGRVGILTALAVTVGVVALTWLVTAYVAYLPRSVEGDNYWLLTTSGVGPTVVLLTVTALATLCWRTRLRSVLQLWLAVSLLLLIFDNVITLPGAARGTVGWFAGRLEALAAGIVVLAVYLREVDVLYGAAEAAAVQSERQRAELEIARDNVTVALEAADMGNWTLDLKTGESVRTPRHDRIFGYDSLLPRWGLAEFLAHVVAEDRCAAEAALTRAQAETTLCFQCRITRAGDGAERWIDVRGRLRRDADGTPATMAGVVIDITDRREAEQRLSQAQKMEAIGQLTGGVAHDFNNLLTVIVGNLDMIVRRPDNAQRVERLATSAMTAARRGAEVTEKLLSFSRRQVLRPETVNPNHLLKDFQGLLQRAVGETVGLVLDLDAALDPVRLDPGQFESAILNLAVNARDAMPGGGTLTIRTENLAVTPERRAAWPDLTPGDYVRVSVGDTGLGMDAATAARAFEPFFTTKDVGKGTGLGLSQVYGFARQGGGQVRVASVPAQGTTITIDLPRSSQPVAEAPRADALIPLRRAAEGEVVLVVEDEAAVLEMAVESLSELGYRTLTATHAAEALERLKGPERIDIMFSDVVMPGGMNGVELATHARALRTGLRVLLASGYTGSALGEQGVPVDLPLLSKPYRREDLADKLRLVMGGR
ncbi:histidine kinase [Methylobacterium sp. Leaf104]|uniref:MASE4 domain-containing protein n=1 Tax=Methylobacterium TaxID=407 RepID=UPI0006FAA66F|nr:MASE4 domain-containing protein [Methylobacterium sp. Leaf104]KQP33691.1 histidine kinase [Methylobacterium sp. Leaf104]